MFFCNCCRDTKLLIFFIITYLRSNLNIIYLEFLLNLGGCSAFFLFGVFLVYGGLQKTVMFDVSEISLLFVILETL